MKLINKLFLSCIALGSLAGFTACDDDDVNVLQFEGGDSWVVSRQNVALSGTSSQTITVRCAATPSVATDASWIHLGGLNSLGQNIYSFTISADDNSTYDARTGNVTVSGAGNTQVITVTQWGVDHVEIVSVSPDAVLSKSGGSVTVKYAATGDVEISVPAWLTRVASKSLVEDEMTFNYGANLTDADRSGEIVVSLVSDPAVSASVTVTQAYNDGSIDTSITAKQVAAAMYAGVNIGNTLEAIGGETAWGQPKVNINYIRGLKAMGFNAVRVPCSWDGHVCDASTNTIDAAWLDRVDEVVGYIIGEGMYAIVNIHWDGGWLENSFADGYSEAVNTKQRDYWTQIANRLASYDEHLLFAGMNEPDAKNKYDVLQKYQQTFIDAVRATGGNNAYRCLVVQGPSTDISTTCNGSFKLPTDKIADRLMVEIHQYDPSDFTIMEWGTKDPTPGGWSDYAKYYWGSFLSTDNTKRNSTWGNEAHIDSQFKKMQDKFVAAGYPVICGEYCAMVRNASKYTDVDTELHKQSRAYWAEYVTKSAKNHGCVPFYWETGDDINRNTGAAKNQYAIDAIMNGAAAGVYPF